MKDNENTYLDDGDNSSWPVTRWNDLCGDYDLSTNSFLGNQ
jgi:hypothetical protein